MHPEYSVPRNHREWQAVIGLDNEQFTSLVKRCSEYYIDQKGQSYEEMLSNNPKGGQSRFKKIDSLIFFTLSMLKGGITFDLLGYIWGIEQSVAHRKFQSGLSIVSQTLEVDGYTPLRDFESVLAFQRQFEKGETLLLDGTEQRIQRPSNHEIQKEYYSGKKKSHTVKSLVVSTLDKYVHFVSYCSVGRMHDFTVLLQEFPPEDKWFDPFTIRIDLGFQGFEKLYPNVNTYLPKKKPRGGELTDEQKKLNKDLAKQRIKVEHAIGGIKRFDILSNTLRLHDWKSYDQILGTCAGLWNFLLTH